MVRDSEKAQYAIRLLPGQDLKQEITKLLFREKIPAAVVISSVGSLIQATLRLANGKDSVVLKGPFEIVSLNGTLSLDGPHLHISLADSQGHVVGGHLLEGSLIHTTCELVIHTMPGVEFKRELDPETGFKELVIREIPQGPTF